MAYLNRKHNIQRNVELHKFRKISSIIPYSPERVQASGVSVGGDLPGGLGPDLAALVPGQGPLQALSGFASMQLKMAIERKCLKLFSVYLVSYVCACPFSTVRLGGEEVHKINRATGEIS